MGVLHPSNNCSQDGLRVLVPTFFVVNDSADELYFSCCGHPRARNGYYQNILKANVKTPRVHLYNRANGDAQNSDFTGVDGIETGRWRQLMVHRQRLNCRAFASDTSVTPPPSPPLKTYI